MKRSIAAAFVAVAILAGGGTGWAIAGVRHSTSHGSGNAPTTTPSVTPTVRATSAGPTPTRFTNGDELITTQAGARIVRFSKANGDIKTASDVLKLHLTSDEFRGFIRDQLTSEKASCPNAEIIVDRFALPGTGSATSFAVGSVGGCGGAATLWTDEYGTWKQIYATQDNWYCPVLRRYHVPDGLIDGCSEIKGTPVSYSPPVKIISFTGSAQSGAGVYVQKTADAAALKGTSTSFRDFIGSMADANTQINNQRKLCAASGVGITVGRYATNGYATGAVNDCGGYEAIWGDIGYGWQELIGSQAEFVCQELHDDGVPAALIPTDPTNPSAGNCLDLKTNRSIRYTG